MKKTLCSKRLESISAIGGRFKLIYMKRYTWSRLLKGILYLCNVHYLRLC